MKATFDHSVNVLVNAYLNNELAHSLCSACAVGNLVADAIGTRPQKRDRKYNNDTPFECYFFENGKVHWSNVFMTCGHRQEFYSHYSSDATEQIDATGYTISQLAQIEYAFETAERPDGVSHKDYTNDSWMFNGLMQVVDLLAEIHNIDLTAKKSAKLLFVKA